MRSAGLWGLAERSLRLAALVLCAALLVLAALNLRAQPAAGSDPLLARPFRDAVLYTGPGDSHLQVGLLRAGAEVRIIERNHTGNWLHVQRTRADGAILQEGWVLSGYLTLHPDLRFSAVPVNTVIPDGDPSLVHWRSVGELYTVQVIGTVSERMRTVYEQGQALGNRAGVITKVGDSLSADRLYLNPMSRSDYALGAYDYLEDTIRFFGASAGDSVAARVGMTSYVIFDPMWADPDLCLANETPLNCEYRLKRPSVSLIMFGSNDVMRMTDAEFDVQMRQIVDATLEAGVIPVLSTFSYHPDADLWWQSVNFNRRIVSIAAEYELPLINLWAAARPLPAYGLDQDRVHLLHSGFENLKFDTGHDAWYGATLRNLLSIRMLDELRRVLSMG